MRSQFRFIMHPEDEQAFASHVLAEESVKFIDGPRWASPEPSTHRSLEAIKGNYCIIWSAQDLSVLSARPIPASGAWYCDCESFTIQFLRSQITGSVITEGRLAVGTSGLSGELGVEKRYKSLVRYAKKHFINSAIQWVNPNLPLAPATKDRSANPSKPDAQVWLGPEAKRWLEEDQSRRIKHFKSSVVEAYLAESAA